MTKKYKKGQSLAEFEEFKVGDSIVCIDNMSEDLDFGCSGIVLRGQRNGLVEGDIYTLEKIIVRSHYPENQREEIFFNVKGIRGDVWLTQFKALK